GRDSLARETVDPAPGLAARLVQAGRVALRAQVDHDGGGTRRLRLATRQRLDRGAVGPGGQIVRLGLDGAPVRVERLLAAAEMEAAVGEVVERGRVARIEEQRAAHAGERLVVLLLAEQDGAAVV